MKCLKTLKIAPLIFILSACLGGGGGDQRSSNNPLGSGDEASEEMGRSLSTFAVSNISCEITGKNFYTTGGSSAVIVDYATISSPSVSYQCTQNGNVVSAVCLDPGKTSSVNCSGNGSRSLAGLSAGAYTLQIQGKDPNTGELSPALTFSFSVDLTPPKILSVTEVGNTTNSVSLSFQAQDPTSAGGKTVPSSGVARIQCAYATNSSLPASPNWVDCTSGYHTQTGLSANTDYYFFFKVDDNANNSNLNVGESGLQATLVHTSTRDSTEFPGLCLFTNPKSYISSNSYKIDYQCPNEEWENSCRLTGPQGFALKACADYSTTLQFTGNSSDGIYSFCIYDGQGGPLSCSSFTKDVVAPSINIDALNVTASSAAVNFSGDDLTSGVTHFTCALENLSKGKLYNSQGQEVLGKSIDDLLDDTSNLCGSRKTGSSKAYASSVSFPQSILNLGDDYRIHVSSWDAAGNKSSLPAERSFTVGASSPGQFLCSFEKPYNDSWKQSLNQNPGFTCSYNRLPTSLTFSCSVTNARTQQNTTGACQLLGTPTLCNNLPNGDVHCSWRGNFATNSVSALAGDRLNLKVSVTDKSRVLGTLIGQGEASDSFRFDNNAPRLEPNSITVVSKSSGILATYNYFEPAGESGLSANSAGITCRLNDLDISGSSDPKKYTQVPCSYNSASIVQTDSLNFSHNYRLEIQIQDIAGNLRSDVSAAFKPTYPYEAPSCELQLVGSKGGSVENPSPADSTNLEIRCTNPAPQGETLAKCLVQARQAPGSKYFTSWQACTSDGIVPNWDPDVPSSKRTMTLNNLLLNPDNLNPLEIKVTLLPCDSDYTEECGNESTLSYFVGKGVDGGWSDPETFVLDPNDPGLTEYFRKTCNKPPFVFPGENCAIESGWTEGAPSSDGYRTEIKLSGVCRNATYQWDSISESCVPNCQLLLPGSTRNGSSCECVAPNSDQVSVQLSPAESRFECRPPCAEDENRQPDGSCKKRGVDGGWSDAEKVVLNPNDPGQAEHWQKTCNKPPFVAPGNNCAIESDWSEGAPSAEGYRTEVKLAGSCRNSAYEWNSATQSCLLICAADEVRQPDGSCKKKEECVESSLPFPKGCPDDRLLEFCFQGRTIKVPAYQGKRYLDAGATYGPCRCSDEDGDPPGIDGGWSASSRIVLDSLDPAQTEYFQRVCNNPERLAPGRDCQIESGWTEGKRTSKGLRTEYQFSGVCRNSKYEWDPQSRSCKLKAPPPPPTCNKEKVTRKKVIGKAVDDTKGETKWFDPIVPGKSKPGYILNHYHLNLEKGKSATIDNECPSGYTSRFVKASGTDFFDCKHDSKSITCKNKDNKGRDMDTIQFLCTCQGSTTPPPPKPDPKPHSCGHRDWDGNRMDLEKGRIRKTDGCTQWITDERFVKTIDGYISVGKYNKCTLEWECANSFKYATQWRESAPYNKTVPSCKSSEIEFMKKDKDIMPKCSDKGARNSCSRFSNR